MLVTWDFFIYRFCSIFYTLGTPKKQLWFEIGNREQGVLTTYVWFSFYGTSNQPTKVFTGRTEPAELNPSLLYFCLLPTYHLFQTIVSLFLFSLKTEAGLNRGKSPSCQQFMPPNRADAVKTILVGTKNCSLVQLKLVTWEMPGITLYILRKQ